MNGPLITGAAMERAVEGLAGSFRAGAKQDLDIVGERLSGEVERMVGEAYRRGVVDGFALGADAQARLETEQ